MTGRPLESRSTAMRAIMMIVLLSVLMLIVTFAMQTHLNSYLLDYNDVIATYPSLLSTLPSPLSNLTAISTGACCGIGHRMARNIPTMVYAMSNNRLVYVDWTDIEWNTLFNDTTQIKQGPEQKEHYGNDKPGEWKSLVKTGPRRQPINASSYDRFGEEMKEMFDMPLAQSIVKSLSDNLSSRVLSFLDPMRNQYASKQHGGGWRMRMNQLRRKEGGGLHLCAHIREGNNESGDWKGKTWRHIDLHDTLNKTLAGMKDFVFSTTAGNSSVTKKMNGINRKVSVFVASDNAIARPWFERHVPNNWHVVKPSKFLPKPEAGVWFGEHGSKTNQNLTKDQKDEAMAEAVADVFALGECDSLFIPNYSSFSAIGITLTRAERKKVFFLGSNNGGRFLEMPEFE